MNGAQAMIQTLVNSGVDVCFTNPGTSEMHFVAALDRVPGMRAVLGLFEGVVTGAADGYARIAGRPAATLLHLGPGLGNGLANLHNARRARTPMVNIVGDHATCHTQYDAPLESDITTVARNVSRWISRPERTEHLTQVTAEAVAAAVGPPTDIATLILPADVSWSDGAEPQPGMFGTGRGTVADDVVEQVAKVLTSGETCVVLVGDDAVLEAGLRAASRIGEATGARVFSETFSARFQRGAGVPTVDRLGYFGEQAHAQLQGARHLILAGAKRPVAFFAYPGKPSDLVPDGCQVHVLADPAAGEDAATALTHLAELVAGDTEPVLAAPDRPERPADGELTLDAVGRALGALLPEGAIVADESNTSGLGISAATAGAPPHDWLQLTGGAIGYGMPVATGAAVADPSRPVINLEADGSAMYTLQALWTQAREQLDVTTIIFNNRSYAILNIELARTGAGEGGPKARDLFDLSRPDIDFVALAQGMGVDAHRATDAADFAAAFERAISEAGPHLIEVELPTRPRR